MDLTRLFKNDDGFPGLKKKSSFGQELKESCDEIKELLANIDPVKGAATFSGLLISPEMQCNCIRLESLIHLTVAFADGKKKINYKLAAKLFNILSETIYSYSEDSAEDVFISLVSYKGDNFKLFEGIWENSAFHLQMFLDALDYMPENDFYKDINKSILGLMCLSEAIANRLDYKKYIIGQSIPQEVIPESIVKSLGIRRGSIKFTIEELAALGIDPSDLEPFVYNLENRTEILDCEMGNSPLESKPLIFDGDTYHVILPTAISVAVRKFMIKIFDQKGLMDNLEKNIAKAYENHFQKFPTLGEFSRVPICFYKKNKNDVMISEAVTTIDHGRYIHFVFVLDNFIEFDQNWVSDISQSIKNAGAQVSDKIKNTKEQFSKNEDFKDGISLIILCGWGRVIGFLNIRNTEKWKIEIISAPDLTTLSQIPTFKSLSLWRLIKARDILKEHSVEIENVNGLLNLYAWSESLNHHLVPHDQIENNFIDDDKPLLVVIEQNAMLNMRQSIAVGWDEHAIVDMDGENIRIKKKAIEWHFKDDNLLPLFVSIDAVMKRDLKSLVKGQKANWWCSVDTDLNNNLDHIFKIWDAASNWLAYSVSFLEKYFEISSNVIHLIFDFDYLDSDLNRKDLFQEDDLKKFISTTREDSNSVRIKIQSDFIRGFLFETNIAERLIVKSFVIGVELITGTNLNENKRNEILNEIIPDEWAKHMHFYEAKTYREFIASSLPNPIVIAKADDSTSRIGLGWLGANIKKGIMIKGIKDCTEHLNEIVLRVLDKIREILNGLNREKTIIVLLQNLEAVNREKERWKTTIRSTLSLHKDKSDVIQKSSREIFKFNAALVGSRIAIEVAICECPLKGGVEPGEIEISKLMSYSSLLFNLGNWSDAIKNEMMKPEVEISPLGGVLIRPDFIENIVMPYGKSTEEKALKHNADEYQKLYEPLKIKASIENDINTQFVEAWQNEYGFSIDERRAFVDKLEDYGIEKNEAVFKITQNDLLSLFDENDKCSGEVAKVIIDTLKLWPRDSWVTIPTNFNTSDIQPWKFRRRLSVLLRPLIQIDLLDNPTFLISPGLVRDGFVYFLKRCYEGSLDIKHFKTKGMKSWIGTRKDAVGHEFNKKVANRLIELGWKAESDVKLTKILNKKLDKDYGDIDVLAWQNGSGRVLCIECKDLEYAKTPGEVSRQLSEFRGLYDEKGKPDRLRKHLKRMKVLKRNKRIFSEYVKKSEGIKIETHLVFSNIVPMAFSTDEIFRDIKITFFHLLKEI
ncbi:MAG: hypothetical protein GY756_02435 [bacterium]|nr:hypothetical protein [bacterium]